MFWSERSSAFGMYTQNTWGPKRLASPSPCLALQPIDKPAISQKLRSETQLTDRVAVPRQGRGRAKRGAGEYLFRTAGGSP